MLFMKFSIKCALNVQWKSGTKAKTSPFSQIHPRAYTIHSSETHTTSTRPIHPLIRSCNIKHISENKWGFCFQCNGTQIVINYLKSPPYYSWIFRLQSALNLTQFRRFFSFGFNWGKSNDGSKRMLRGMLMWLIGLSLVGWFVCKWLDASDWVKVHIDTISLKLCRAASNTGRVDPNRRTLASHLKLNYTIYVRREFSTWLRPFPRPMLENTHRFSFKQRNIEKRKQF